MEETTHDDETKASLSRAQPSREATRRRLFVMRSGAHHFAVYADEVEATSENLTPTPLPFAPAPVRGVVSRRGRILTLIDPLPLLTTATSGDATTTAAQTFAPPATQTTTPQTPAPVRGGGVVVALKGDEQLALAVESIERDIELYDTEAGDAAEDAPGSSLLRRTIQHDAHAVALLDPARLFDAAMQGVERRRQRT